MSRGGPQCKTAQVAENQERNEDNWTRIESKHKQRSSAWKGERAQKGSSPMQWGPKADNRKKILEDSEEEDQMVVRETSQEKKAWSSIDN